MNTRRDDGRLTLFLCGDVMLGRGIDQILPHPLDPTLRESYCHDARDYVALAEAANGPIPRPAAYSWPWGDALDILAAAAPDARIMNLETSITRSDRFAPGKGIHYRMNPANLPGLTVARPDVCTLANNHVLDFGRLGLQETLSTMTGAGLQVAGAGLNRRQAQRPATVTVDDGRILVIAFGTPSSGIPSYWAATDDRAGVDVLPELSRNSAPRLADRIHRHKRPGDIVVASVHWGSNWGYDIPDEQIRLAHQLIDNGADIVHGHSSHHPRPIEVYRNRLILYGCGDLINDYEGIGVHRQYRDDLRLMYLASIAPTGELACLRMAPTQARRMQLHRASPEDTQWTRTVLGSVSRRSGVRIDAAPPGMLTLRPN
ncbi:CapA family protein [Dactylosporangium sp. NPDC005572]|uniref:CapA family protein n=1 Tax=Dactylosporangium sp. NPDC005572 TaxID=3156889 RepID=UPI0033A89D82